MLVKTYISGHTGTLSRFSSFALSTNHMITFLYYVSYTYADYICVVMSLDAWFTYIIWCNSIFDYDGPVE